jgi:hypothetical protein
MRYHISLAVVCALTALVSAGGPVQVRGYTKKDGTYVAPHTRSAPGTAKSAPPVIVIAPRIDARTEARTEPRVTARGAEESGKSEDRAEPPPPPAKTEPAPSPPVAVMVDIIPPTDGMVLLAPSKLVHTQASQVKELRVKWVKEEIVLALFKPVEAELVKREWDFTSVKYEGKTWVVPTEYVSKKK